MEKTESNKPAAVTVPTAKTLAEARKMLEGATLTTLAAAAINAAATLTRLQGTADAVKGSLTTATLRVVAKESLGAFATPLRETCEAAGGRVPNLSTVRAAIAKMGARYGHDHGMPVWGSVAEAKLSGDTALQALVDSCVGEGGVIAQARVDAEAAYRKALSAVGIADKAITRMIGDFAAMFQVAEEKRESAAEAPDNGGEPDSGNADAQIVSDAAAAQEAEIAELRAIAAEARRIFGVTDNAALQIRMLEIADGGIAE